MEVEELYGLNMVKTRNPVSSLAGLFDYPFELLQGDDRNVMLVSDYDKSSVELKTKGDEQICLNNTGWIHMLLP